MATAFSTEKLLPWQETFTSGGPNVYPRPLPGGQGPTYIYLTADEFAAAAWRKKTWSIALGITASFRRRNNVLNVDYAYDYTMDLTGNNFHQIEVKPNGSQTNQYITVSAGIAPPLSLNAPAVYFSANESGGPHTAHDWWANYLPIITSTGKNTFFSTTTPAQNGITATCAVATTGNFAGTPFPGLVQYDVTLEFRGIYFMPDGTVRVTVYALCKIYINGSDAATNQTLETDPSGSSSMTILGRTVTAKFTQPPANSSWTTPTGSITYTASQTIATEW